jgi:hypothetical protein
MLRANFSRLQSLIREGKNTSLAAIIVADDSLLGRNNPDPALFNVQQ